MTKKSCLLFCYNKLGGDFKWADQKAEKTNLGPKKKDLELLNVILKMALDKQISHRGRTSSTNYSETRN